MKRTIKFTFLNIILFILILPNIILAAKDSECLICHSNKDLKQPVGDGTLKSIFIDKKEWERDIHKIKGFLCIDCHTTVSPFYHPKGGTFVITCEKCHLEALEEHQKSIHQNLFVLNKKNSPKCYTCHIKHKIRKISDPDSSLSLKNISKTCGSCHNEKLKSKISFLRPGGHKKTGFSEKLDIKCCTNCHLEDLIPKLETEKKRFCVICHNTYFKRGITSFLNFYSGIHEFFIFRVDLKSAIFILFLFIFTFGLINKVTKWQFGATELKTKNVKERLKFLFVYGLGNRKILRNDLLGGIAHLFIMWGFILLLLGHLVTPYLKGYIYLVHSLFIDIVGLLYITGNLLAILRRYYFKKGKMDNLFEDPLILIGLLFIGLTGFFLEGLYLYAAGTQFKTWAFMGKALSSLLNISSDATEILHNSLWIVHIIITMLLLAYIPFSKLFHIISSPINIYLEKTPTNILSLDMQDELKIEEFTKRQLISLDACARCNRCENVCPSFEAKEPFSPRQMIQTLKKYSDEKYGLFQYLKKLINKENLKPNKIDIFQKKEAWGCTTCGSCKEECPLFVQIIDNIREIRRTLIEEGKDIPENLGDALESIFKHKNPWNRPKSKRSDWLDGIDTEVNILEPGKMVEYLYYVGCTPTYDTRCQEVARATVLVLKKLGIDFAILGNKEVCCGDVARRVGEDGLFEEMVINLTETLSNYKFEKMLFTCPHGYYTLNNEYPSLIKNLGIEAKKEFKIFHIIQILNQALKERKLRFRKKISKVVTFHDSCYLGRYSGIYEEPRKIIEAIDGVTLVEMERVRDNSFCCGGGGGRMWVDYEEGEKISEIRVKQAVSVGAELILVACPFCLVMLDDAIKTCGYEGKIAVKDIIELVREAL
jgi:Fe-S oxidoreductase/nitrate reductase gamma subunit